MKKLFSVLTAVLLVFGMSVGAYGEDYSNITDLGLSAQSVILVEASSGSVLYENNSDEKLPPASITKVMTLLLIYEAVRDGKINWDGVLMRHLWAAHRCFWRKAKHRLWQI